MLRRTFLQMLGALGLAPLFGMKATAAEAQWHEARWKIVPTEPHNYILSAAWNNLDCTEVNFCAVYDSDLGAWREENITVSHAASDSGVTPSADSPDRA